MEKMTSKEIIKKIITHDSPPRIGFDFLGNNPTDFIKCGAARLKSPMGDKFEQWGRYPELVKASGGFSGEVMLTPFGNIYGRFEEKTKGECVKGALQDGWELFDDYRFPLIDMDFDKSLLARDYKNSDKFVLGSMPLAIFSPLRDIRHMDNALMDMLLESENVIKFLEKTISILLEIVRLSAKNGLDGVIIFDDLGMQHALFMSPDCFRKILKPFYKILADEIHSLGMFFFVHSCGLVYDIIEDFIEAGVDVLQFDQPELSGSDVLAGEFGSKVTIYSPVDIQKIMPTCDEKIISDGAVKMVNSFKAVGGSLIVMDYGAWADLNVDEASQQLARDVVISNSALV